MPVGRTKLKKRQLEDQFIVGNAVGTTSYVAASVNPTPYPLAYVTGAKYQVKPLSTSTGNITLNVAGIGVVKVFRTPTVQATTGDWIANQWLILIFDELLDAGAGAMLMTSTIPSGSGGGSPGGPDGAVQYKAATIFAGDANFTVVEVSPGVWAVRIGNAATGNEGRLYIGGATGLGAIEFGGAAEIRGALGLDVKVDPGANGWRLFTNALQRMRISDAGELMIGAGSDPGTAGQFVRSAGPGSPFAWQSLPSWSVTQVGGLERSTSAEAIATADAIQAGSTTGLADRGFSELETYDFERAMSRLFEGGTFSAIVNLTNNRRKFKQTIAGAIAYTKTGTYAAKHEGNIRVDYLTANGVNKPTFSSDFIVVWDNWLNTNGQLNTITFEYLPSGKIAVDMRYD
jgi:hypothetical protein